MKDKGKLSIIGLVIFAAAVVWLLTLLPHLFSFITGSMSYNTFIDYIGLPLFCLIIGGGLYLIGKHE